MRRDPPTARLILALAAAGGAVAAAFLPPVVLGSVRPALGEVAVGTAFALIAVLVTSRRRPAPAVFLAAASISWVLSSSAPLLPAWSGDAAARLSLLPHALLVATVAILPDGRLRGIRAWVLASTALATGIVAGLGLLRPALLMLGIIAVTSAVRRWRGGVSLVQLGLGVLFLSVDAGTLTAVLPIATAGHALALGMIVVAATIPLLLDRARDLWLVAASRPATGGGSDGFGMRLGRALGTGPLRVAFPLADGRRFVDFAGEQVMPERGAGQVSTPDGRELALVSPAVRLDPLVVSSLTRVLRGAGEAAALRAELRESAAQLAASQRLLLRAEDEERVSMERLVSNGVASRIQGIIDDLADVPAASLVRERATATRDELTLLGMRQGARELHELVPALAALVESSGSVLVTDIPVGIRLPEPALRAAWFVCVEGVVNAVKHAPGASLRIDALQVEQDLRIVVADDGPGGAHADGSGLRGLADRAADVGGSLVVASAASGTRLVLTLPNEPPRPDGKPVVDSSAPHDAGDGTPFLASMP